MEEVKMILFLLSGRFANRPYGFW